MLVRIEEQVGVIPAPIVDDTVEIHVTERIHEQIGPEPSEEQVGGIPVPTVQVQMLERTQEHIGPEQINRLRNTSCRGHDPESNGNPYHELHVAIVVSMSSRTCSTHALSCFRSF